MHVAEQTIACKAAIQKAFLGRFHRARLSRGERRLAPAYVVGRAVFGCQLRVLRTGKLLTSPAFRERGFVDKDLAEGEGTVRESMRMRVASMERA